MNYIKAYADDNIAIDSKQLISTLNIMTKESQFIFDQNQKVDNSTTKSLIEALAKKKLDSMTTQQILMAVDSYNNQKTIIKNHKDKIAESSMDEIEEHLTDEEDILSDQKVNDPK